MTSCIVLFYSLLAPAADPHERLNPLYADLREKGIPVGADTPAKLPPPLCPDGLDEKEQQAVLKEVVGKQFRLADFTRNSRVAPERVRIREIKPAGPRSLTRSVEVVFVAYGDLNTVADRAFLDRVLDTNRKEGKATPLPPEELKKRGITVKDPEREGYARLVFNLIDKVELHLTGRSLWSRTPESIVVAGRLDERFKDDAEYPNQWKPILKDRSGKKSVGKAEPYDGAGYYVKVTRLASPKGALLVEGHIVFAEPAGWFGGTNLLVAKLPPVMQSQVRAFRRELMQAAK
jgi:hypothetical protein